MACVALPGSIQAQPPDTLWTRGYPNGSNALSIVTTLDGGYIISEWIGFPYDAALLKIDSLGNVQWERTYGDPETSEVFADAKPCPSGGYVAVGHRYGFPTYYDPEIYVVRTDNNGDTLWTRTANVENRDALGAVEVTDNGDLICVGQAGYVGATSDAGDVLIMRYSDAGDLVWLTRYRGEFSSGANDIVQTGSDRFIVGGQTGRLWEDDLSRAYVLMVDGTGDTLWTRTYGLDTYNYCQALVATDGGGFALTGATTPDPASGSDVLVMRADSLGNLLWGRRFGYGAGRAIRRAPQGGFAVFHGTDRFPDVGIQYELARLTATGDTLWAGLYGTSADDYLTTGIVAPDNGYLMLGLNAGVYVVRTLPEPLEASGPPSATPNSLVLLSVYPNPFNSAISISYSLPNQAMAHLALYDVLGRKIQSIVLGWQPPGSHRLLLDTEGLSSGMYFLQLDAGKEVKTVRLILQK